MSLHRDNVSWLKNGRQRAAVARVLRKPMTTSEICAAAREFAPRIRLRDAWLILSDLQDRALVRCPNPRHATGKLYALTSLGRDAAREAFGQSATEPAEDIDWKKYAQVARAKVRRLVLLELAQCPPCPPRTATLIRKRVNARHPLGLSLASRALRDLERLGLIGSKPVDGVPGRKEFFVRKSGRGVAEQLGR